MEMSKLKSCSLRFFCLLYLDTGYIALENEKLSRLNQELVTLSRKLEDMKQGRDSTIA